MGNRYETYGEIASGGMATIEYGRLFGPHNFTRPVAIKRLHAHFAKDPAFAAMFIDEARLSARLIHANIIPTLDVIDRPGEIALVMEYVHGEALSNLLQQACARTQLVPIKIAAALVSSVLHGLHAAHESRNERDELLGVVHRDVSPHNILVGADGVPRVLDFGIAKAVDQLRSTPNGEIKGKLAYIAPEQLRGHAVDRRADVFGAAAVLWETLTGFMLFEADNSSVLVQRVLEEPIKPPSTHAPDVPSTLDAIVMRGLAREPEQRYATAREMALELERSVGIATQSEVSDWLQELAGKELSARAAWLRKLQEQGGVPLLGTADSDAASTRTVRVELTNGAATPSSTPASIETPLHVTEVRARWPWFAGGLSMLIALALVLSSWLRGSGQESSSGHAITSPNVVQAPVSAQVAPPAAAPAATDPAADAGVLPSGRSPAVIQEPAPPPRAAADGHAPVTPARAPTRRAQNKRPNKSAGDDAPAVKPAAVAEPKCSPVIYVGGIRRINPDCPQNSRSQQ